MDEHSSRWTVETWQALTPCDAFWLYVLTKERMRLKCLSVRAGDTQCIRNRAVAPPPVVVVQQPVYLQPAPQVVYITAPAPAPVPVQIVPFFTRAYDDGAGHKVCNYSNGQQITIGPGDLCATNLQ